MLELPTIDVSPTAAGDEAQLIALAEAARRWGVFFIEGHGIPRAQLCDLLDHWRAFFERPAAEKASVARVDGRGYTPAPAASDPTREYKESFTMMRPQPEAAWPTDAELRARSEDAFERFAALSDALLRLLARAFGQVETHFLDAVGEPASVLRVVHYPAPTGSIAAPLRCEVHTDYGTVSILLIDDAPGQLQLLTGPERWEPISVARGQLLVNLGDTLERWTEGRWAAPIHRVVNPSAGERAGSQRLSIVFFHNPASIVAKVVDYLRS